MRILDSVIFPGRSIYAHFPVAKITLDLEGLTDRESCEFPHFCTSVIELLPGLLEHKCSGREGGFPVRLREGTYFGHVLEHIILEVQASLGYSRAFGKTNYGGQPGVYAIIFEYALPGLVQPIVTLAMEVVNSLLNVGTVDINEKLVSLGRQAGQLGLGPSTAAIIAAARRRGISVRRIGDESLLQLGTGIYSRRLQATVGPKTSCLAADIAGDKAVTKYILATAGIPVPFGLTVETAEEAVTAWRQIGRPVAVKPKDGNQGKGVSLNLNTEGEVAEGFHFAQIFGGKTLVEEYIEGRHYRLLVVNGQLVAAAERMPAQVVGDGVSSIEKLIVQINAHPLRGEKHEKPLTRIVLDELSLRVLKRQGYGPLDVPAFGTTVLLRDSANLSTGGTACDVTEEVHAAFKERIERVARLIGLDIAGVDVVTPDISAPTAEMSVIEVNAAPGIRMHHYPAKGQARDVAGAIVEMIFPPGKPSDVPLITVTGTNGKTTTTRLLAAGLRSLYRHVGCATSSGIYINQKQIVAGDTTGPWSAGVLLADPIIDAVVLEVARGGIIRGGLGYDLADVAVITNIADDHLGQDGVEDLAALYRVKSLVTEAVRVGGLAVVNAENTYCLQAGAASGREVIMFAVHPNNALASHLRAGGRGVLVEEGAFRAQCGSETLFHLPLKDVPLTFGGLARHNVENCAAAIGAMWASGVPFSAVSAVLQAFAPDLLWNPGRQNILRIAGISVMLDYGHNVPGITAVADLARGLCNGRLIGVVSAPGDRTDQSIMQLGEVMGAKFDQVFIKEDADLRGRRPGETARLLRHGLAAMGKKAADEESLLDEATVLKEALGSAGAGDWVVVFYESLECTLGHLRQIEESRRTAIVPAAMTEAVGR
ncbi:MAG: cyanophycin synthetase [Peptococcaceae bacterium]|nr:cyanophycin synthetase [Peptococcaceae bacterium]